MVSNQVNGKTAVNTIPDSIPLDQSVGTRPELLVAIAEAKSAVGLAYVRAQAWAAWAADDAPSYDEVHPRVLHAVRELGLPLSEAQVSSEMRSVAGVYASSAFRGAGPTVGI
jgi:hypothetical protein